MSNRTALAQAQEGANNVDSEEAPEAPADEPPQAAADEPEKPAEKPAAKATPKSKAAHKSQLRFYYDALGLKYRIVFLGLFFTLVALLVINVLAMRRSSTVPQSLVEAFEAHLNEQRYQEAYDLAANDGSFLGHVLAAGLGKLFSTGYPQAVEAMQEAGQDESLRLEHRLGYIALIGTISPIVGLLGTVEGMVASFQSIAHGDRHFKPSLLADGISMALVSTLVGLLLAIPAIAAFGILKNRLARTSHDVAAAGGSLMQRFQGAGQKQV
ncbi:MAG TPA: MotA/TolQ/ExbB proton channel family protein [Pirellulales bacterium]|jgi:biopolymer transport protein ExbB|nr:MotA/TolQ/ExbB proton channel family protein [Pirellulales bacterium]